MNQNSTYENTMENKNERIRRKDSFLYSNNKLTKNQTNKLNEYEIQRKIKNFVNKKEFLNNIIRDNLNTKEGDILPIIKYSNNYNKKFILKEYNNKDNNFNCNIYSNEKRQIKKYYLNRCSSLIVSNNNDNLNNNSIQDNKKYTNTIFYPKNKENYFPIINDKKNLHKLNINNNYKNERYNKKKILRSVSSCKMKFRKELTKRQQENSINYNNKINNDKKNSEKCIYKFSNELKSSSKYLDGECVINYNNNCYNNDEYLDLRNANENQIINIINNRQLYNNENGPNNNNFSSIKKEEIYSKDKIGNEKIYRLEYSGSNLKNYKEQNIKKENNELNYQSDRKISNKYSLETNRNKKEEVKHFITIDKDDKLYDNINNKVDKNKFDLENKYEKGYLEISSDEKNNSKIIEKNNNEDKFINIDESVNINHINNLEKINCKNNISNNFINNVNYINNNEQQLKNNNNDNFNDNIFGISIDE